MLRECAHAPSAFEEDATHVRTSKTTRCGFCVRDDERSALRLLVVRTTGRAHDYYDEAGTFHLHYEAPLYEVFKCSRGHAGGVTSWQRCAACGDGVRPAVAHWQLERLADAHALVD